MQYEKTKKEVKKNLFKNGVKETVNEEVRTDKKSLAREKINNKVFDIEDSVSDNSKMISLLITLMSRMYESYTDTQKARFSPEDKFLIEYTFNKFKDTNTRADIQFANEGPTNVIDKLLNRQKEVGEIVK